MDLDAILNDLYAIYLEIDDTGIPLSQNGWYALFATEAGRKANGENQTKAFVIMNQLAWLQSNMAKQSRDIVDDVAS